MTAPAAQWQLDRLSTSAREAAEIASLGAGLSLSSWLARLIGDTCAAEGVVPPSEASKILEFTREIRDRTPAAANPPGAATQPAPAPMIQAPVAPAQVVPVPLPPAVPPLVMSPVPMPAAAQIFSATPQPSAAPLFRPALQPVAAQQATPQPLPIPVIIQPIAAQAIANVTSIAAARMPQPAPQPAPMPAPVAAAPTLAPPPAMMATPAQIQQPAQQQAPSQPPGVAMLPVTAIVAANLGTRRGEDIPEPLLADIATRGVRQPITVRRSASHPDQYEIICGHRRWRAAQRVGLGQVPAMIVAQDDATAILSSLAENLLQNNLSVLDESQAYLRLLTQCAVDASAVIAAISRDRKHIVQSMRLLGLPPLVRHLVGSGMLSREHATLLLDAPNPEALADAILAENLSVDAARQRMASMAGAEAKS